MKRSRVFLSQVQLVVCGAWRGAGPRVRRAAAPLSRGGTRALGSLRVVLHGEYVTDRGVSKCNVVSLLTCHRGIIFVTAQSTKPHALHNDMSRGYQKGVGWALTAVLLLPREQFHKLYLPTTQFQRLKNGRESPYVLNTEQPPLLYIF